MKKRIKKIDREKIIGMCISGCGQIVVLTNKSRVIVQTMKDGKYDGSWFAVEPLKEKIL